MKRSSSQSGQAVAIDAAVTTLVSAVAEHELDDHAPSHGESEASHGTGSDDALGLYLKQMGAIPLLNRNEELYLARKLEVARQRFRRAALYHVPTLRRILELF